MPASEYELLWEVKSGMKRVLVSLFAVMVLFAVIASASPPASTPSATNQVTKTPVTAAELGLSDALANYLKAHDLEPIGFNERGDLLTWSAAHNGHVIIGHDALGHPWFETYYGDEENIPAWPLTP